MTRAAGYLRAKAAIHVLTFDFLIRRNVLEQLDQLRDIRMFQIRVSPAHIDEIARADPSVAALFGNALALGEPGRIEVILRPVPYSREGLPARVREAIRAIIGHKESLDAVDVFKTAGSGYDGRSREIDLLRDELVTEREVRRVGDRSRALESGSVYAAIESAYDELRPALEAAAGGNAA
jgi:hypothetical protein